MAIYTFFALANGNTKIRKYYNNGRKLWKEIKASPAFDDVESLAQELTCRQKDFESQCGGPLLGREIMAMLGISQFYSIKKGFKRTAKDVLKVKYAFIESQCCEDQKQHAVFAASMYGLCCEEEDSDNPGPQINEGLTEISQPHEPCPPKKDEKN